MNKFFMRRVFCCWLTMMVLGLVSCKKSGGPGNGGGGSGTYYIRFKVNGNAVEYDVQATGAMTVGKKDSVYAAVLVAYKEVAGLKNAMTIAIFSNNPIASGVGYNDPGKAKETGGLIVPQATLYYYDSASIAYLTAGSLADNTGYIPLPGVVADARLTITELTASSMKGTFSGTVYKSSDLSHSQAVTQGEFYLRRTD